MESLAMDGNFPNMLVSKTGLEILFCAGAAVAKNKAAIKNIILIS